MKDRKTTPAISEDECQELLKRSKRVSSAPPPISPLDPKLPILGGSCVAQPEPGPANWKYWRNIESIELWQGLLLSLNIEPTGGGVFIQNMPDEMALIGHRNGGGFIPYEYMDSKGITTEFLSRWHMIRNKLETAYAASGLRPSVDLTDFIRLPVFAVLAANFEWEPLPIELAALAENSIAQPAPQAPPTTIEIRKRNALIDEVTSFWPSVSVDLNDSVRNGLRDMAKSDKRGYWFVQKAIEWARQRGKIDRTKATAFVSVNDDSVLSPMLRALLKLP